LAFLKFADPILRGRPIDVYDHGDMWRDLTYVADLVRGIRLLFDAVPGGETTRVPRDSLSSVAPYRIVNIGNSDKVRLEDVIAAIETATNHKAARNYMYMQPGDVPATWADASLLRTLTSYQPQTDIREGVAEFVKWFRRENGI
jgi:UDP-glucuronate 4-epimerase